MDIIRGSLERYRNEREEMYLSSLQFQVEKIGLFLPRQTEDIEELERMLGTLAYFFTHKNDSIIFDTCAVLCEPRNRQED